MEVVLLLLIGVLLCCLNGRIKNDHQEIKCCEKCTSAEPFQQVGNLTRLGIKIYRYISDIMTQAVAADEGIQTLSQPQMRQGTSIYIIINTNEKNMSKEMLPDIDISKIPCQQCRYRMEKLQNLLKSDHPPIGIRNKDLIAVCDHCRLQQQSSCISCEETVQKFLALTMDKQKDHRHLPSTPAETTITSMSLDKGKPAFKQRPRISLSVGAKEISGLKKKLWSSGTLIQSDEDMKFQLDRSKPKQERKIRPPTRICKTPSDQSVVTSFLTAFSPLTGEKEISKGFKYVFPKDVKKYGSSKVAVATSSELIRDTQVKMRRKAEEVRRYEAEDEEMRERGVKKISRREKENDYEGLDGQKRMFRQRDKDDEYDRSDGKKSKLHRDKDEEFDRPEGKKGTPHRDKNVEFDRPEGKKGTPSRDKDGEFDRPEEKKGTHGRDKGGEFDRPEGKKGTPHHGKDEESRGKDEEFDRSERNKGITGFDKEGEIGKAKRSDEKLPRKEGMGKSKLKESVSKEVVSKSTGERELPTKSTGEKVVPKQSKGQTNEVKAKETIAKVAMKKIPAKEDTVKITEKKVGPKVDKDKSEMIKTDDKISAKGIDKTTKTSIEKAEIGGMKVKKSLKDEKSKISAEKLPKEPSVRQSKADKLKDEKTSKDDKNIAETLQTTTKILPAKASAKGEEKASKSDKFKKEDDIEVKTGKSKGVEKATKGDKGKKEDDIGDKRYKDISEKGRSKEPYSSSPKDKTLDKDVKKAVKDEKDIKGAEKKEKKGEKKRKDQKGTKVKETVPTINEEEKKKREKELEDQKKKEAEAEERRKKEERQKEREQFDILKYLPGDKSGDRDRKLALKQEKIMTDMKEQLHKNTTTKEKHINKKTAEEKRLEKAQNRALNRIRSGAEDNDFILFRITVDVLPLFPKSEQKIKKKFKDLKLNWIHVTPSAYENLISNLISFERAHRSTQIKRLTSFDAGEPLSLGSLSLNSDLEIIIESLTDIKKRERKVCTSIIKGNEIIEIIKNLLGPVYEHNKIKRAKKAYNIHEVVQEVKKSKRYEPDQILFKTVHELEEPLDVVTIEDSEGPTYDPNKQGIVHYCLSNRRFIEKGWTVLPTEKIVRKMNVYRVRPANQKFNWFEHNKSKGYMRHDTGEKLAEFDDNGRGRWYYKSGQLALDYYDSKETNVQQRFVIYSNRDLDERGRTHPVTVLAMFDYLGNGVVFDHSGKIRVKYNQTEGVVLDRGIGPASHWKWHSLNDPPVLQQVMIDTKLAQPDPELMKLEVEQKKYTRPNNEDMLAIELDNFVKEKTKKLSQTFRPFQIKMKALKINEQFSLRILDQSRIYLNFKEGSTNIKLNLGMVLDNHDILDTETEEVAQILTSLERPPRTDSLNLLQDNLANTRRLDRVRTELKIKPMEPSTSADRMIAAVSKPPRQLPKPTTTSRSAYRKPSQTNLYYDTRLI